MKLFISDLITQGPWVDVQSFANLAAAVASPKTAGKQIWVTNAQTVSANLTIPADRGIKVLQGGLITIPTSVTLTINGPFEAGNYQVFNCVDTGSVAFSSGTVPAINPEWSSATTDSGKVQWAVDTAKNSSWIPIVVNRMFTLTTPIIIDRAVDSTVQEFRIIGLGLNAGFYTSQAINMFSSTLVRLVGTEYHPSSEFVTFEGVRFESSANTINNYVLDGNKFLRMKFLNCYFRQIRMATTTQYFQSFYIDHCNIRLMKGKFLEAVIGAGGLYSGKAMDMKITNNISEFGDRTTESAFMVLGASASGCDLTGNLFENSTGPFFKTGAASGVNISGNYYEDTDVSPIQLGQSSAVNITGNLFTDNATALADPNYYDIDCQTSLSVNGAGNYTNGRLYKESNMTTATGTYGLDGLISNGDFATIALSDMRVKNRERFIGILTGMTASTQTYVYMARSGNTVTMTLETITGTSNTADMSMTGIPVAWLPKTYVTLVVPVISGSVTTLGAMYIGPTGVSFSVTPDHLGFTGFAASGVKGLLFLTVTYSILQ